MDTPRFQLAQNDAVAWLRALPASSVDLVITDPPYESLEKHRAIGTTTRLKHSKASSNDWFSIFPNSRFPELFAEVYRVLAKDTHFYLFCDPETMFVAKPLAEQAGFKFWKPLIWDKCLAPDTLVWTERGVIRLDAIVEGDRVAIPEGGSTTVRAVRRVRSPSVKLALSDGTEIIASREHRFMHRDGRLVEAQELALGDALCSRPVRQRGCATLNIDEIIPDDVAIYELPEITHSLWCDLPLDDPKRQMAEQLGIKPKRFRRWMRKGRIPRVWARALGIEDKLGKRVQCYLQNDVDVWYPRTVALDYELGKVIGLYAAKGATGINSVDFALHADEKPLHATIARFARRLGSRTKVTIDGNQAVVSVLWRMMKYVVQYFVGGTRTTAKYFKPCVYAAPDDFRRGVLDGMIEGDGHWSHIEQRESYASASPDLAMFVRRELQARDRAPNVHRFENEHAGGWTVRFDPIKRAEPVTITAIEDVGEQDLVDISISDRSELFLLANGVVTHNCKIGMGYHYRARYECVLFFEKGKRKLADLGIADIIEASRIMGGYPAEKPAEVSEVLVKQSSELGQLVIDPFMGSGSVGVAAVRNGRNFLGNDLCAEAVAIARERLREAGAHEGAAPRGQEVPQLGLTL